MFHKIFPALVLLFIITGCQNNADRKIKLSTSDSVSSGQAQSVSTVLQVNPEQQRSVAIVLFRNETGKKSLDWLQRGLTDMLTTDLKQSPYLNVYSPARIIEIAKQSGKSDQILNQPEELDELIRHANIDVVLTGRYYQEGKNLYIDVEMRDVQAAKIMYVKSVEGESLEKIFSMVDELSSRVRENLRSESREGIDSSVYMTQMTNSIEAFRFYSKGLEYQDKLFVTDAARSYMEAIRLDSTFAAAYLRLALLNQLKTDKNELFNLIDKAKKHQNKLSETDRFRLKILETNQKNNYEDNLALLKEAVEKYPNVVEFHNDLAEYYHFVLMDIDKALTQYEIARELDPSQKLLYNNLGYLYAERGDFQTALSYFEKYRELAPDEPNPLDSKAEILIRAGKFDEAESELKTVVERWPNFSYSAIRLSNLYRELGDYQKALAYSEKVKVSEVSSDQMWNYENDRALIYWRFGKIREAGKWFKLASKKNPNDQKILRNAAEFFRETNNQATASLLFRETFEQYRNSYDSWKHNYNSLNKFMNFALNAYVPYDTVMPLLEKLQREAPSDFKPVVTAVKGLLDARTGNLKVARQIFIQNRTPNLNIILRTPIISLGLWKNVLEISETLHNSPAFADFYEDLMKAAKKDHRRDIELLARFATAQDYNLTKNQDEVKKIYNELGTPEESDWKVIGPFGIGNYSGFQHEYPPENKIDVNVTYPGKKGDIQWRTGEDSLTDGFVNLKSIFGENSWSVAYGLAYAYSPAERKVQIRLGADDGCKLWLNNTLVWQHAVGPEVIPDRDMITVLLQPGYNKLLLKVTNETGEWGYFFRITDSDGKGYPDITFHNYDQVQSDYAHR